jgi:hypothetical protein
MSAYENLPLPRLLNLARERTLLESYTENDGLITLFHKEQGGMTLSATMASVYLHGLLRGHDLATRELSTTQ